MDKLKKSVLIILSTAVLLFVITVVINLPAFDEELKTEVTVIKNIKAESIASNNAYPAMLAFNREGDDLLASADEIRKLLNQKIAEKGLDYFDNDEYDRYVRSDLDESWQQHYKSCNSRRDNKCLTEVFSQLQAHPVRDPRLQVQLQKYQQLLTFDDFSDSTQMDFTSPIIAFGPILKIKRIYLVNKYQQADTKSYVDSIEQDLQFWHMLLKKGHLMITKMVAVASVHDSIAAASLAVRDQHLTPEQLSQLQAMWQVLPIDTLNMNRVFDFEFKCGIDIYEQTAQSGEFSYFGLIDFFQINATHNLAYEMTQISRELALLASSKFYQRVNREGFEDEVNHGFNLSVSSFYNPTGKMLLSYSTPAYTDYIARIHDMNGMIALLKLQIEIAMSPYESVEKVITESEYRNPYTKQPMLYNKGSNSIYFDCMDKTSVCELDL